MKYLDARKQDGKDPKPSIKQKDLENKMQPGSRPDQRNPEDLISSPRAGRGARNTTTGSQANVDPKVQNLANELNVNLADVQGTGPNGAITEKDVRQSHRETQHRQENK